MEDGRKLLDFSQKLDITLLDRVVACMYNSTGEQVRSFYCGVYLAIYIYQSLTYKMDVRFVMHCTSYRGLNTDMAISHLVTLVS